MLFVDFTAVHGESGGHAETTHDGQHSQQFFHVVLKDRANGLILIPIRHNNHFSFFFKPLSHKNNGRSGTPLTKINRLLNILIDYFTPDVVW
jgi:hypothetical protein